MFEEFEHEESFAMRFYTSLYFCFRPFDISPKQNLSQWVRVKALALKNRGSTIKETNPKTRQQGGCVCLTYAALWGRISSQLMKLVSKPACVGRCHVLLSFHQSA